MESYSILIPKTLVFFAVFPFILTLSFIRTLAKLTFASLLANLLQSIGLALIVEYLLRDINKVDISQMDHFRPISETALGFGSAMFAFEGISVVLPLYSHMRRPKLMASSCGVINVSFVVILALYFVMGLLGYLKYGSHVCGSITLNLPATPLYDCVRAMFTVSILLSYPLQFYVPNEIIWNWAKRNLLKPTNWETKTGTYKVGHCHKAAPTDGADDIGATDKKNFKASLVAYPPGSKVAHAVSTITSAEGVVGRH